VNLFSQKRKIDPSDPSSILEFLETIRNRRDVRELTKKSRKVCPKVARVLIDERDVYMINSLRRYVENGGWTTGKGMKGQEGEQRTKSWTI
jgi:hypothetical protein